MGRQRLLLCAFKKKTLSAEGWLHKKVNHAGKRRKGGRPTWGLIIRRSSYTGVTAIKVRRTRKVWGLDRDLLNWDAELETKTGDWAKTVKEESEGTQFRPFAERNKP